MSNYMIYLLFVQPEMLLAGTRQHLFTTACSELEKLFENGNVDMSQAAPARQRSGPQADEIDRLHSLPGPGSFARFTTKQAEDRKLSSEIFGKAAGAPGTTIHNACRVGKALLQFGDEETVWEVMEGVWVEVLCYSASRCRGYLHAKSLGSGGEFLSYVWLLLSYMGMESLADRFQQPEPTEEEDDGEEDAVAAGPSTSQSQGPVYESEIHPV
ncbi:hypothetical protein BAE44_0003177 [Dichanthelium oligosanthes]|uniref:Uncharacterized protein n=1 Tax=Dichanthelium oligosanthes TaxID=888268 RepID=A0A1E5WEL2_9POAL|nr:hypothetical protein BAE44_0003177 [Dichanthelium oligosanthes]